MRPTLLEPAAVAALVDAATALNPLASAIGAPGRQSLTYAQLQDQVYRTVAALHAAGIGRGDRVATLLPSSPETAVASVAVMASATLAPLNPALGDTELTRYVSELGAKALIVPCDVDSPILRAAARLALPLIQLAPRADSAAGMFDLRASQSLTGSCDQAPPREEDVALVLHTSGTTSRPKVVPLTQRQLHLSARSIAQSLQLTPADCCLNVMPLFHVHGLIGAVLSSLAAGASVVCTPGFVATEFYNWLEEFSPSWYTAVPTMHQAIVARAERFSGVIARNPLRLVRSCSAALPLRVADELSATFGVPVVEAYGMTEAAHQIASTPLHAGGRRPGSVGRASGPQVAIMDAAGGFRPTGRIGEIVICGPSVMLGYENAEQANASSFVGGWLRTGDQGYLDDHGYLFITGRLKELINRAGEKIAPLEVDEALLAHPSVEQAVAFGLPHPTLGEDVAAAVVVRPGHTVDAADLRAFVASRLASFKVPRLISIVDEIPKGPTGKPKRSQLGALLGLQSAFADASPLPGDTRTLTAAELSTAQVWAAVLRVEVAGIRKSTNFFHLGGDSILAAQVVSRLEAAPGIRVDLIDVFEQPTLEAFTGLMQERLRSGTPADSTCITRQPSGAPLPLSSGEERTWWLDQVAADRWLNHRPLAWHLAGPLDATALQRSLMQIVGRHESLRTTFPMVGGKVARSIGAPIALDLPVVDLRNQPSHRRQDEVARTTAEIVRRPMDLSTGPLLHATLLRLGETEHILLVVVHHIVFDGWSEGVFREELAAFYTHMLDGSPEAPPELPIQYADFAAWQCERVAGDRLAAQLDYWRSRLADRPPVFELPADHPRPMHPSLHSAVVEFTLPPNLVRALEGIARQSGATLFMVLVSAFNVLLARHTGLEDVLVGVPVSGRLRSETESLIGFFVNTLVLRTDVSGDPTFLELLNRVRRMWLEAYAHQDLPFERLVADLQPERDSSRHPLVQVACNLRNVHIRQPSLQHLETSISPVSTGASLFDLSLDMTPSEAGLMCMLEYRTDLFEALSIERMTSHFVTLVEGISAEPTRSVSSLPLLTPSDQSELLQAWNDTRTDFPAQRCVHDLVAEQVMRRPAAVAVETAGGQERLTYLELDRRANALADRLRQLGVGRGERVAVCLERSPLLVVALLGVLKAGGAYIPLDPAHPRDRLTRMLDDAQPRVLLAGHASHLDIQASGAHLVQLHTSTAALPELPEPPADSGTTGDDPAYVMYTSGSTGMPKGVVVPHRAVTRLVCNANYLTLRPADSVAQASNASFDAATFEIWGALINGARLVVVPTPTLLSAPALAETIKSERLSVLFVTTALFNELARSTPDVFGPLRCVLFGGETADPESARRVLMARPPEQLLHMYGPTETTTFATWYPVKHVAADAKSLPIGRPISNTTAYVLDTRGQPVPLGVPGELYIGGPGVASRYLNRAELTDQKFVADRFAPDSRTRVYRTGDLVRRRQDGNLEFLGRTDNQIKLRGFRIEPREIEARLLESALVHQALVVVREDTPGEKQLVAYVVLEQPADRGLAELRGFLRERLPVYMLPSAIVPVASLSMTPNGKLDREALRRPAPELLSPDEQSGKVPPRDEVERQVSDIWGQVLGRRVPGVFDNFFDLGGHSLLAARVVAAIEKVFGTRLPLSCFLGSVTVAELASRLRNGERPAEWESLVPIQVNGDRPPLFAVHGAFGDVLCFDALASELGNAQPVYGLQAPGLDGVQAPLTRVEDMAQRYIAEIRTVQPHGPYHLLGYSSGGSIVFEMACQLERNGDQVAFVGVLDHPPSVAGYGRPTWDARWAVRAAANLGRTLPVWINIMARPGWRSAPAAVWSYVRMQRGARAVPTVRDDASGWLAFRKRATALVDASLQDWPDFRWRLTEGQYAAVRGYRPLPYPGKLTVFRASRQPLLCSHAPDLGWGRLATGGVVVKTLPASHSTILQRPFVSGLARALRASLAASATPLASQRAT